MNITLSREQAERIANTCREHGLIGTADFLRSALAQQAEPAVPACAFCGGVVRGRHCTECGPEDDGRPKSCMDEVGSLQPPPAEPSPESLAKRHKDHEIALLVNDLTAIARVNSGYQQLRQCISQRVQKFFSEPAPAATPAPVEAVAAARELIRLADIMRDCGRLVSASGAAERWMRDAAALLAHATPSTTPQEASEPVVREFTNELGNRIKITIEGPTSTSENILTPKEVMELRAALGSITPQEAPEFPPMTKELASILGTMCFHCITFAQCLRMAGHEIKTRAEDEQAAVLHWMLGHYFRHGDEWRKHAAADMERMRGIAAASLAKVKPL